ncbi:hypothetical protein FO519_008923 [Halicephalobus sp. NKZ332]|nr:hypothetical protein FO519_008923 [Halicephalobus sp. NKZ332]
MLSAALVYLSCNIFVLLPCMKNCSFYSETALKILTSLNTIGYYSELAAICLMTVERFMVFFTPETDRSAAKKKIGILVFPWIFGLFIVGINTVGGCYKKFNSPTFQYITVCEDCNALMKPFLIQFMFVLGQAAPGGMFICYLGIIGKVVKIRTNHNLTNKKITQDFKLFGTTLTGVLVTNICGMINPSVNAIVMFTSNNRIQQTFAEIVRERKLILSTTAGSEKSIHPVVSRPSGKAQSIGTTQATSIQKRPSMNVVKIVLRPPKQ